jgi:hypothetical protein
MKFSHLSVTYIALLLLITGCASNKAPTLSSAAKAVRVVKADPDGSYQELGPITATDGSGCGLFGTTGTYDNAVFKIKALAAKRGGDYVQIFNLREPYFRPACFDNAYVISGTLFKKTAGEIVKAKPPTKADMSVYSKLRELKKLQTEGVITTEEFESQKKLLLNSPVN